jgi:predicted flap endonuclease-1-like 5' DNA nuclease
MALSDEVRRLTQRLRDDLDTRMAAVQEIEFAVAQQLGDLSTERRAMAEEQHQRLAEHMAEVGDQGARSRAETAAALADMAAARRDMADRQRQELDRYTQDLRQEVGRSRHDALAFVDDLHSSRLAMSAAQRETLTAEAQALRDEVASVLNELGSSRQAMAKDQRHELRAYIDELATDVNRLRQEAIDLLQVLADECEAMAMEQAEDLAQYVNALHQSVAQLRADATALLATIHSSRQEMAEEQRQGLDKDRRSLRSSVQTMRNRFQSEQERLRTDYAEAQQVWESFCRLVSHRRSRRAVPSSQDIGPQVRPATPGQVTSPAAEADAPIETKAPTATEEEPMGSIQGEEEPQVRHDDLATIHGIGLAMRRRLEKAGIHGYEQLAQTPVAVLREIVGESPLLDIEDWIRQARELASSG